MTAVGFTCLASLLSPFIQEIKKAPVVGSANAELPPGTDAWIPKERETSFGKPEELSVELPDSFEKEQLVTSGEEAAKNRISVPESFFDHSLLSLFEASGYAKQENCSVELLPEFDSDCLRIRINPSADGIKQENSLFQIESRKINCGKKYLFRQNKKSACAEISQKKETKKMFYRKTKRTLSVLLLVLTILLTGCQKEKLSLNGDLPVEVYKVSSSGEETFLPTGKENRQEILSVFDKKKIHSGVPNCAYDYIITVEEDRFGYHKECGNVTMIGKNSYFKLTEKECQILDEACQAKPLEDTNQLAAWIKKGTLTVKSSYCREGSGQDKVLAGKSLKALREWIIAMNIMLTEYPKGETPQDNFASESYSFDFGKGKRFSCYIDETGKLDLLFDGTWYTVNNPNTQSLEKICNFDYSKKNQPSK